MSDLCNVFKDLRRIAKNTGRIASALESQTDEALHLRFELSRFGGSPLKITGAFPMALTLPDDKTVTYTVSAADAKGNPATLDGAPVWTSSDDTIGTVTAAADGLSAEVAAVGPIGTFQVTVHADARMGAEVVDLIGTADIEVVAGEAVTLTLTAAAPA